MKNLGPTSRLLGIAITTWLSMNPAISAESIKDASFAQLFWIAQGAKDRKDYTNAEKLYNLAVKKADHFPDNDCRLVRTLQDLAACYEDQGSLDLAAPIREQIVSIYQKQYGSQYPRVARACVQAAFCYRRQGSITQAESFYKQGLEAYEKSFGMQDIRVAEILGDLGQLYIMNGDYDKAEPLYVQALAICSANQPYPETAKVRHRLADELSDILETKGESAEAQKLLGPSTP